MRRSFILVAISAAALLASCGQQSSTSTTGVATATSEPAPAYAARVVFNPSNPESVAATGVLTYEIPTDRGSGRKHTGSNGLVIQATILNRLDPAVRIGGHSLAQALSLPAGAHLSNEAAPVVLQVLSETPAGANAPPLCAGGAAPTHLIEYDDTNGGMRILPVSGGMPGAPGSSPCTLLTYDRQSS